ncbi:hypothetical protein [Bacillus sp. OAE603]|uniref:hypothetical protein n=1 Tax=Gottfriedia sp. OAE603 TaxID=2663872 RepID=UPI001789D941
MSKLKDSKYYRLLLAIIGLILSTIAVYFSQKFQDMAYDFGPGVNMKWYWVGAVLSYFFIVLSIVIKVVYFKTKNISSDFLNGFYMMFISFSIMLLFWAVSWTTFIIIAWQSDM